MKGETNQEGIKFKQESEKTLETKISSRRVHRLYINIMVVTLTAVYLGAVQG